MMKVGTIVPQSLRVETELYSQGWEIIKNSDAYALDRDIRRADWNFFFLAGSIQATALGYWRERTVRRTMERVLAKAERSNFNCLEITEVSAKQFLGFPSVHVSAHSRHIQKSPFLQELAARAEPQWMPTGLLPEPLRVVANNLFGRQGSDISPTLPLARACVPLEIPHPRFWQAGRCWCSSLR
jgi:hypothetical protein